MGIGGTMIATTLSGEAVAARAVPQFDMTLFDTRYGEAAAFARLLNGQSSAIHGFDGDVTALWSEKIAPRWRNGSMTIAGMTTPGPLFCLERWAWDAGMRVHYRVDHEIQADGSVRHHVAPNVENVDIQRLLDSAGAEYPSRMAEIIMAGVHPRACCANAPGVPTSAHLKAPLVTWVIAPRAAA